MEQFRLIGLECPVINGTTVGAVDRDDEEIGTLEQPFLLQMKDFERSGGGSKRDLLKKMHAYLVRAISDGHEGVEDCARACCVHSRPRHVLASSSVQPLDFVLYKIFQE